MEVWQACKPPPALGCATLAISGSWLARHRPPAMAPATPPCMCRWRTRRAAPTCARPASTRTRPAAPARTAPRATTGRRSDSPAPIAAAPAMPATGEPTREPPMATAIVTATPDTTAPPGSLRPLGTALASARLGSTRQVLRRLAPTVLRDSTAALLVCQPPLAPGSAVRAMWATPLALQAPRAAASVPSARSRTRAPQSAAAPVPWASTRTQPPPCARPALSVDSGTRRGSRHPPAPGSAPSAGTAT